SPYFFDLRLPKWLKQKVAGKKYEYGPRQTPAKGSSSIGSPRAISFIRPHGPLGLLANQVGIHVIEPLLNRADSRMGVRFFQGVRTRAIMGVSHIVGESQYQSKLTCSFACQGQLFR